jgi:hypothetical protein
MYICTSQGVFRLDVKYEKVIFTYVYLRDTTVVFSSGHQNKVALAPSSGFILYGSEHFCFKKFEKLVDSRFYLPAPSLHVEECTLYKEGHPRWPGCQD